MTLKEALNEQMKDDESFKKEYEALGPEYEIISSFIAARNTCNVIQKHHRKSNNKNPKKIS